MSFAYDRQTFFDYVRPRLFAGGMSQSQVNGMNALIDMAEVNQIEDNRHFGYMLSTTYHETSQTMQPIEEYGKGQGMAYGVPDPITGQTYFGRGFCQLTWRENYARADKELDLDGDDSCEWHAENALDLDIASSVLRLGMVEGWFRSDESGPQTLGRYLNENKDDPYNAREIINGDKHIVPSWSNGESIGSLIAGYYMDFTAALNAARYDTSPQPEPGPSPTTVTTVITIVSVGPLKIHVASDAEDSHAVKIQGPVTSDAGCSPQSDRGQKNWLVSERGEGVRGGRSGPKR